MGKLNFAKIERTLSCNETAKSLAGKCGLSQRECKALRVILKSVSVQLADYDKVVKHLNGKDVGNIKESQCFRFMLRDFNRPCRDSPIENRSQS